MLEADARITINKLLEESGWVLSGNDGVVNVRPEVHNEGGFADYVLEDKKRFPLCVIEAKKSLVSPLEGKEQARRYAEKLGCRFAILSNGVNHYFWDIEHGSPTVIAEFPSQERLELRRSAFNPPRQGGGEIGVDYIAKTQFLDFEKQPEYLNEETHEEFLVKNNLRLLRDYQLEAVRAVQNGIENSRDRFLLEMATGTGKTLTSSALIKMFISLYGVKRVLFLVDRTELEKQAQKEFDEVLQNKYRTVIWKENRPDWNKAEIVVSTVQSFINKNKYRKVFRPDDFDLVISDEAHRSLGARSRRVFEYFIGFKLGLTATPKDYLKSVDIEDIAESDPRQLERRLMMDTYTTFGCENGEPTFRYSLENGVNDDHLVNPKVIDARSEITTELLSEKGYLFQSVGEDGNDVKETVTPKDFEKKFFSASTNIIFCETFLKHAMRDPYTDEIGKTLVFCVSQNHAAKVAHILNVLADKAFPNRYNSDFAVQVTSRIEGSQEMTVDFRNNKLNGNSGSNQEYRTSKTRVCVTVGMMTTGYNCTDILNICLMRPIYSPSDFIQMKGRGTRRHDFSQEWMTDSEILEDIDPQKRQFLLFDFFGNYEYFEKDFEYDKALKLPLKSSEHVGDTIDSSSIEEMVSTIPDLLAELREIEISSKGMKVDRDIYRSFKEIIGEDKALRDFVNQRNFIAAGAHLKDKVWNKPEEFFTLEKIRKSIGLDRRLAVDELLLHVFGFIKHIPSQKECLEDEFDRFDRKCNLRDSVFGDAKECFEAYAADSGFRSIIDSGRFAELGMHTSGHKFMTLPRELRRCIPSYIRKNVNLERLKPC